MKIAEVKTITGNTLSFPIKSYIVDYSTDTLEMTNYRGYKRTYSLQAVVNFKLDGKEVY